ncbi:hypothetical protein B2G69_07510 [Methylorubrum zatmanii]|nr:hypothetical protein [Methylorubrum zatmanii]ARO54010.1 hypothetical protein B2G69_07510 [Methylorubrum zatmanii]
MSKRNAEPKHTAASTHEIIDLLQKTSKSMSTMDGNNQALVLLRTFNWSDRVYGLWPDSSRFVGYAYSIMKGALGSAAMRRVAKNPEIFVTTVLQESEDHAELTREIYVGLETGDAYPETYMHAFNLWIDIAPANFAATKERIRGYILG